MSYIHFRCSESFKKKVKKMAEHRHFDTITEYIKQLVREDIKRSELDSSHFFDDLIDL